MKFRKSLFIVVLVVCVFTPFAVHAQEIQRGSGISAECGNIIEGEFTANYQEETYKIDLKAGDSFDVAVIPLGGQLNTAIFVTGPTNLGVAITNGSFNQFTAYYAPEQQPKLSTGILSSSGKYTIRLVNFSVVRYDLAESDTYLVANSPSGVGVYTIYIGCTLRDGTVINPGDTAPAITTSSGTSSTTTSASAFSGVGFPGLAPVDFSAVAKIPMIANVPMTGAVTAEGNIILGYTIDAAANDTLALSFTRLSGNLNLGLVVLSADNKVVFQASLVTSSALTTTFTLPSAGQYTIGVFRIDLLPPAAPEPTAFQLQATLNP